jgi:hypothetical protein
MNTVPGFQCSMYCRCSAYEQIVRCPKHKPNGSPYCWRRCPASFPPPNHSDSPSPTTQSNRNSLSNKSLNRHSWVILSDDKSAFSPDTPRIILINDKTKKRNRTHIIPPQTLRPTRIKASRIRRPKLPGIINRFHKRLRRIHNRHFHARISLRKRLHPFRQHFVVLRYRFAFGCDVLGP